MSHHWGGDVPCEDDVWRSVVVGLNDGDLDGHDVTAANFKKLDASNVLKLVQSDSKLLVKPTFFFINPSRN